MSATKTRRIAWSIMANRKFLRFKHGATVDFNRFPLGRGNIPRTLWYSTQWREEHITLPTIRERVKCPRYMLTDGALPR